MTEPDTPGVPRSKRPSGVIKDEFIVLFPGVSDYQRSKMTVEQMEKMIQDEHRKPHATADAKAKADGNAKKKSDGRFAKFNLYNDRGIQEADLSMSAQIVWDCIWRHECNGVAVISIDRIMRERNISERSVYNGIAELRKKRMLEIIERGNSRSMCSKYRLFPLPTGATVAPVEESTTGATIAATGAKNDTPTEGQNVSGRSVLRLQNGRSDPAGRRAVSDRTAGSPGLTDEFGRGDHPP